MSKDPNKKTKVVPFQSHEYVKRIKNSIEQYKWATNQSRLSQKQKGALKFFAVPYVIGSNTAQE